MTVSKSIAQKLQLLFDGKKVSYATFGNFKSEINIMLANGVLNEEKISEHRKVIFCNNPQRLQTELKVTYSITDLAKYILSFGENISTRAENLTFIEDESAKYKNPKVFEGFLVNCEEEIFGNLNGKEIALKSTEGSFVFINDFRNFQIDADILVVSVENFENFKFIAQQKYLFPNSKFCLFGVFKTAKAL